MAGLTTIDHIVRGHMSLFAFGKEKTPGQASDLVLAYLEDALRVKSPFVLKDSSKNEVAATIHSVNEDAATFRLSPSGPVAAEKGEQVEFIFIHEGLRIGATTQALEIRTGVAVLLLPETLELKERRRLPRARLNPKEGAFVNAFQDLLGGVGISGSLENLSESGFRVRVESAITINTEKHLVLGTTLVPAGQTFKIIRLNKVSKCPPTMETAGRAIYLAYDQAGLVMGFAFDKLHVDTLHGLIASRTTPIPSTLPQKVRRQKREEEAAVEAQAKDDSDGSDNFAPKAQDSPTRDSGPPLTTEAPHSQDRHAALHRLKKMSRALVIYSPSHQSGILKRFLGQHGFGRILIASTIETLLEYLQQANLGLLFIDWDGSTEEAIELMKLLSTAFEDLPPAVLAARQVSESLVIEVGEIGFAHFMVKPYACDESLAVLLDKHFLHGH